MKIDGLRLAGIRCFDDTGWITLSPRCNLFVGANNAGKSTLIKGVLAWQGQPFVETIDNGDLRPGAENVTYELGVSDVPLGARTVTNAPHDNTATMTLVRHLSGQREPRPGVVDRIVTSAQGYFVTERDHNLIVPLVARRKVSQFNQSVDRRNVSHVNGTLQNLYSRIDTLVSGHPERKRFEAAVQEILDVTIATRATETGKEAGFYFDKRNFVSLERMGDGVSEMIGLIAELCLEEGKVFVLEEPETNIHPSGLKTLLALIRVAADRNQFIIATHSNVVVRELAIDETTKVYRVSRTADGPQAPSEVDLVLRTPAEHRDLLAELGYAFGDFDLHDGWLFLEEASAEAVFTQVLMPLFAPELSHRIRTFSTRGLGNLEPSVVDFTRLITFVHLETVYRDRLWIRVDSDGQAQIDRLRKTFSYLDERAAATFSEKDFERYYPAPFQAATDDALALTGKVKQAAKDALRDEVLSWSKPMTPEIKAAWAASAAEPIAVLTLIEAALKARQARPTGIGAP